MPKPEPLLKACETEQRGIQPPDRWRLVHAPPGDVCPNLDNSSRCGYQIIRWTQGILRLRRRTEATDLHRTCPATSHFTDASRRFVSWTGTMFISPVIHIDLEHVASDRQAPSIRFVKVKCISTENPAAWAEPIQQLAIFSNFLTACLPGTKRITHPTSARSAPECMHETRIVYSRPVINPIPVVDQ